MRWPFFLMSLVLAGTCSHLMRVSASTQISLDQCSAASATTSRELLTARSSLDTQNALAAEHSQSTAQLTRDLEAVRSARASCAAELDTCKQAKADLLTANKELHDKVGTLSASLSALEQTLVAVRAQVSFAFEPHLLSTPPLFL